jgi:hypothetical protein
MTLSKPYCILIEALTLHGILGSFARIMLRSRVTRYFRMPEGSYSAVEWCRPAVVSLCQG